MLLCETVIKGVKVMKKLVLILMLCVLPLTVQAASKKLGRDGESADKNIAVVKKSGRCKANSDCATNYCNAGTCSTCTSNSNCETGYVCNLTKNSIARAGVCVKTSKAGVCTKDADCLGGQICNTAISQCVQCMKDSQCQKAGHEAVACDTQGVLKADGSREAPTYKCMLCKEGTACGGCTGNYVSDGNGSCRCADTAFNINSVGEALKCVPYADYCICKQSGFKPQPNGNGCCCVEQ